MKKQKPKYLQKVEKMINSGKIKPIPGVHHITVLHDDWCNIFVTGVCNCIPEIDISKEH